jgi:hypothetical protein
VSLGHSAACKIKCCAVSSPIAIRFGFCPWDDNLECWRQDSFKVLLSSTFSPHIIRSRSPVSVSGTQASPSGTYPPGLLWRLLGVCFGTHNPECWRQDSFKVLLLSTFSPDIIRSCSAVSVSGTYRLGCAHYYSEGRMRYQKRACLSPDMCSVTRSAGAHLVRNTH